MLSDGYTELAPGRLAALVTYLRHDLTALPPRLAPPLPATLQRLSGADVARYRRLFRLVGTDWLWFSRLLMPETKLAALLDDPGVHAWRLVGDQGDFGLLELDLRDGEAPELAFFGLAAQAIGAGWGRWLMAEALNRARELGAARLLVHTCSFDHPKALAFYCRSGFVPYRRALDVFEDPRLDGTLPRNAAAFMPVIDPQG
jgi:GNAT superfamily N-acetyltransferase